MDNPRSRPRQHGVPIHIDRLDATGSARALEAVPLLRGDGTASGHDEAWLQKLIFRFPQALPVREVDAGYAPLLPVCLELPAGAGYVDNLFVTEDGDLAIVECKLWRNPQARREVIAQIIDYAHAMSGWTYEDLERAVGAGSTPDGGKAAPRLYDRVLDRTDLSEADFVDAVQQNLRLGRMLLLVVGDGIREGVETLTGYLQLHAGFHFTLALIEMPVYRLPGDGFVLQPRILARTVSIERGIVRIVGGQPRVEPIVSAVTAGPVARPTTGTQARVMETLAANAPSVAEALRRFGDLAAEHGIVLEPARKSVMIKWYGPDNVDYALGGVTTDGQLNSASINWSPNAIGLIDAAHEYLEALADLVGGSVRRTAKPDQWYVVRSGTTLPQALDALDRAEAWLALIDRHVDRIRTALDERYGEGKAG
jgi:hypothetical protein